MKNSRKLGKEERVLWGKVAKTTRPISGRLEDLLAFDDVEDPAGEPDVPLTGKGTLPRMLAEPAEPPPQAPDKKPKIHQPMEKPVKRKLTRGRLPLEGRIDLHGMFQSEAHAVLLDFLLRAHERGLRHVLVITGKGRSIGSDGALKRAVPMWFSKPEYRHLISSYEDASANHGGDGALYVRLSRRRGEKS
ncbi:DNA-nicking Smr family endonuclease [Agrobacterium pusense]|uniref:Smr/MutS family protein n=1 Tax=Agrobacterium pusense TaxID=648995 RepID=UPI00286769DD|nr:Smr/MutS family protein [Agrobacterium pusense]MDR6188026.1 DNA-nicking Smr family endonuclease [Agrobacterium pusense]